MLVDFFLLGDDLFAELCLHYGQKLAAAELPTQKAIGPLLSKHEYDDLIPRPLDQLGDFHMVEDLPSYDEIEGERSRLRLIEMET